MAYNKKKDQVQKTLPKKKNKLQKKYLSGSSKNFDNSWNQILTDLNNVYTLSKMISLPVNNRLRIFYGHTQNAKQLSDWLVFFASDDQIVMNKKKNKK